MFIGIYMYIKGLETMNRKEMEQIHGSSLPLGSKEVNEIERGDKELIVLSVFLHVLSET